jgi:D-methionine transport system substrate-binding protein
MSTSPQSRGNFAIYSGLKLTNAFALEKMTTPYINVVAVKRDNADSPCAQDIVSAYKSPTFKNAILSDRFYDGFNCLTICDDDPSMYPDRANC